jgi:Cu+-exporting ATPase
MWFERLAGDTLTCELEQWLGAGGPGATPLPDALAELVIARTGEPTVVPAAAHSAHHHDDKKENAMSDTTVIDPVCGMTVDPATAAATAEHDGTTYYFCAKGCQKTFLADPAQHV